MAGSVFIYNLFNEPATLSLNGGLALALDETDASRIPMMGDAASGYRPSCTKVGSSVHNDADTGLFYRGGNGINDFKITWDSGLATNSTFEMPTVSDGVSIDEDLLCYVTKQQVTVLDTRGIVRKQNELQFQMFML